MSLKFDQFGLIRLERFLSAEALYRLAVFFFKFEIIAFCWM